MNGICGLKKENSWEFCSDDSHSYHLQTAVHRLGIKKDLKDIGYSSSTIIYHLDSANLSKYTDYEIDKIYSR